MNYVYQMVLGATPTSDFGLLFSSEIEGNVVQSPIFVLPVPDFNESLNGLLKYLVEEKFYFPGILQNEVAIAESEPSDAPFILNFRVPNTSISIPFELGIHRRRYFYRLLKSSQDMPMLLPYVGGIRCGRMVKEELYIPLIPIDVIELDDVYRNNRFAFVGLTPMFGESIENLQYK